MKPSTTVNKLAQWLSWLTALILVLLPFHAILTVWLSSVFGHYTLLRLWKEFVLFILAAGALYLLIRDAKLRKQFLLSRLTQLIAIYWLVSLVWGLAAYGLNKVTLKALGYGLIVNLRFLTFFLPVWIIATKSPKLKEIWPKLVLIPAGIVVVISLIQRFFLPYDFLKHFGYNENTIFPYETINHNIHYSRIMSTLRGANPLGAYLVLIVTYLVALFTKVRKQRGLWGIFGISALLAMIFSYSRGAWAGLVISLVTLGWVSLKNHRLRKLSLIGLGGLLVISIVALLALRNNAAFQNVFFHTQSHTTAKESSNAGHVSAFRNGLHDAVHEPLGKGVGTAGPASVYNNGKARIAENYYIQLAQEVGWLGLLIFLAINFLTARELWFRRSDVLAAVLLASLLGLVAINLVSHAWTDDTIAYIWWGLAGIALAQPLVKPKH